jgi:hypothetical protein
MTSSPAALQSELEALRAATARMAQVIEAGGTIDLTALEDSVAGFCARLRLLPEGGGGALRSGLIALMDDLGRLDGRMRLTQAELGGRLGETEQRRRATTAYGSVHPARK